jgi:hypothetical protein
MLQESAAPIGDLQPEHYYFPYNRKVCAKIRGLAAKGVAISTATVADGLDVPTSYVSELTDGTWYADEESLALRRQRILKFFHYRSAYHANNKLSEALLTGDTQQIRNARALVEKHMAASEHLGQESQGLSIEGPLDPSAPKAFICDMPEDASTLRSLGYNVASLTPADPGPNRVDIASLSSFRSVFLVGNHRQAMQHIESQLPKEALLRLHKTPADLLELDPDLDTFRQEFNKIVRLAEGSRQSFEWQDLLDENEIATAGGTNSDDYAVQKLIPKHAISMFFGTEKSGKSLLLHYFGKCVANGVRVFGKYATTKMMVLCLDLENIATDFELFTRLFGRIGPEKITYKTRLTGIPDLGSPSFLSFCQRYQPLLLLDSLTKFMPGVDMYNPAEVSTFFDRLLNLCVAGATIIINHHATRDDGERYANSHQIGANVARAFAVVSEDKPNLRRVRLEGVLFRGAEPITEYLVGFPVLEDHGMFAINAATDPFAAQLDDLVAFVRNSGGTSTREAIKSRPGHGRNQNYRLLDEAISRGLLIAESPKKGARITIPDQLK